MGLLTAKIFVLHSGYASVTDKNFKNDDRIKKIITLQIQNELLPYTLFGTLPLLGYTSLAGGVAAGEKKYFAN